MSQQSIEPKPSTIFRHVFSIYAPMAMLAGMQLDIFTPLRHGPMSADELAKAFAVRPEKLQILLYALVYAELLTVDGDRFANTPETNAYLVRGRAGYLGSNHENYSDLWSNLLKIGQSIRLNAPQGKHDFRAMSDAELGAFLRGLHAGAMATGEQLATQFGLDRASTLLDIGGGSGGVAIAVCQACPELSATIVELPRVAPFARSCVEEAKLLGRIQVVVADVLEQPPEGQFDAAVLRHFIQIMGPKAAQRAIRNI